MNVLELLLDFKFNDENIASSILSIDELELFEERAAILEFVEGVDKDEAEKIALERILIRRKIWN